MNDTRKYEDIQEAILQKIAKEDDTNEKEIKNYWEKNKNKIITTENVLSLSERDQLLLYAYLNEKMMKSINFNDFEFKQYSSLVTKGIGEKAVNLGMNVYGDDYRGRGEYFEGGFGKGVAALILIIMCAVIIIMLIYIIWSCKFRSSSLFTPTYG